MQLQNEEEEKMTNYELQLRLYTSNLITNHH